MGNPNIPKGNKVVWEFQKFLEQQITITLEVVKLRKLQKIVPKSKNTNRNQTNTKLHAFLAYPLQSFDLFPQISTIVSFCHAIKWNHMPWKDDTTLIAWVLVKKKNWWQYKYSSHSFSINSTIFNKLPLLYYTVSIEKV